MDKIERFRKIGGATVVQVKRKTAAELLLLRFLSDSYRIHDMQSFAISIKCITFVNQMITFVNSYLISRKFHLIASWWLSFNKT